MRSDIASEFVGTWRLVSIFIRYVKRRDQLPQWAGMPRADLSTTPVSAWPSKWQLRDRAPFTTSDLLAATDAEVRSALREFIWPIMARTLSLPIGASVVHRLEMSSIPNWMGSDQVRYFELQAKAAYAEDPSNDPRWY